MNARYGHGPAVAARLAAWVEELRAEVLADATGEDQAQGDRAGS